MENKKYIVTETLEARPMNLGDYNTFKGWRIPENEDPTTEGYLVTYTGGYTSWRRKEIFEGSCATIVQQEKTMHNSDSSGASINVPDIVFFGDGDTFKLISKASSKKEKWLKSTKAMEIDRIGCVVQVTTQQGENVAEAVVFVPEVKIEEIKDETGKVTGRKLVSISQ